MAESWIKLVLMCLQMKFVWTYLAVAGALSATNGANILGVFPITGRSHWVVYESVMKALAARGHNVTVITSYAQTEPVANYTEIDVLAWQKRPKGISVDLALRYLSSVFDNQRFIAGFQLKLCRGGHDPPQVRALLDSGIEFEAVSLVSKLIHNRLWIIRKTSRVRFNA